MVWEVGRSGEAQRTKVPSDAHGRIVMKSGKTDFKQNVRLWGVCLTVIGMIRLGACAGVKKR